MYQISCAACNGAFEYNVEDYIHVCPFCSSGFVLDLEEGSKELIGDHFVIPNVLSREQVEDIFQNWLKERYHRQERIKDEFKLLGFYGICLPYWVVSVEVHTYWAGHSKKANEYPGQGIGHAARFVREEGRFTKRYRWAVLARKSPKEHWGLERLHHPKESVLVDWDGFPLDESLGKPKEGFAALYSAKRTFKFEHVNGCAVAGIQMKESVAIARARDQLTEYHRRIAKTKVGSLSEHRTEIEIVGIQLMHVPFWVMRYAFSPKSIFRYLTPTRERRLLLSGYTAAILEAELPIKSTDKVLTNLMICSSLAILGMFCSAFIHPLFLVITLIFTAVAGISVWKLFSKPVTDPDVMPGVENNEPLV